MFGFTVVAMLIDRNPIDSFTSLIWSVGIAFVMLHVNTFVENLAKPDRYRFQNAKKTIEQQRTKVRVMNEIVRYAVDVPGNAHRIDKAENDHDPQGNTREQIEHGKEVNAVNKARRDWDRVPTCVRKNPRGSPGAFDTYELV